MIGVLYTRWAKWAERCPKIMKQRQRWNTLQISPRRDSNTGDSDLWSNALPLDHGGAPSNPYEKGFKNQREKRNGTRGVKVFLLLLLLFCIPITIFGTGENGSPRTGVPLFGATKNRSDKRYGILYKMKPDIEELPSAVSVIGRPYRRQSLFCILL